jgi:hypothetical protein
LSPERLFTLVNAAVLPAWILLAVAPGWRWTQRFVHAIWIPLVLAGFYLYAMVAAGPFPEGGGFSTLPEVMVLFTRPMSVLAGWIHYLAFDLFVGAWEARDALRRGIGRGWMVVPLFFTLMAGPLGLALYLGLRWVFTHETGLAEAAG